MAPALLYGTLWPSFLPSNPRCPAATSVVISAYAGGVPALLTLVKTLPADFSAPIFVVRPGVIYVVRPYQHLLLEGDQLLVTRGPKENRFRPSIDALFRSAAYTFGPRGARIHPETGSAERRPAFPAQKTALMPADQRRIKPPV